MLIKKLYETTYFSNIEVELQNGILNIIVKENPIIDTIVIKGEKAKKYTKAVVDLFKLKEKSSYISNYINSDINVYERLILTEDVPKSIPINIITLYKKFFIF